MCNTLHLISNTENKIIALAIFKQQRLRVRIYSYYIYLLLKTVIGLCKVIKSLCHGVTKALRDIGGKANNYENEVRKADI